MKLVIENVRGFAGRHELTVKPITVLVGENSSGKTTLLAALAAVLQKDFPNPEMFNRAPFELGSFDTIATYRGGKFGRSASFTVGVEYGTRSAYSATFISENGSSVLQRISIREGQSQIEGDVQSGSFEGTFKQNNRNEKFQFTSSERPDQFRSLDQIWRLFVSNMSRPTKAVESRIMEAVYELSMNLQRRNQVMSLAPLRSRPKRTYDALIDEFKPEGDHVPLLLSKMARATGAEAQKFRDEINDFGSASGLFQKLDVRRMGKLGSDPFQIRIKSTGPDANLVDVGYGVSQALPIVADSMLAKAGVVLVQQPEVHLHPRAQAALGSLFARLASDGRRQFVIETHSDYLLDRVRMAVAEEVLKPSQVNIVYLERVGLDVKIHELSVDPLGNILNAPPGYRQFFLEEEISLLFPGGH